VFCGFRAYPVDGAVTEKAHGQEVREMNACVFCTGLLTYADVDIQ